MIDTHCHLEQKDYDKDRDKIIESLRGELKALITVCANPEDWEVTKQIVKKHKGFVFAAAAIHPQYIKEIKEDDIDKFIGILRKEAKSNLVGIGECGLDYKWIEEQEWREKQKEMFVKFIRLAKEINLTLVVHSWDSDSDVLDILEREGMSGEKVMLHQFEGKGLAERVEKNGWFVSFGPGIQRSKHRRKLARDLPLSQITLETDSPWFGDNARGTPLNAIKAAEEIAEIKKVSVEEVLKQTDLNAEKLFGLKFRS